MMGDRERGLYGKFIINRTDGTDKEGSKHHNCAYFVLDLTHDPHAIPALEAYRKSCLKDNYYALAEDLENMITRVEWEQKEAALEQE